MSYRAGILTGLVAIVGAYIALYSYFCLLSGQSYTLLSPPPDLLEIVTAIQTSVANGPTKPITAFEVGGLWMSNSLDETRTSRQWHLGFNFRDLIAIPPEGTRCDMIWPASDDPPTYMSLCQNPLFALQVSNFQSMKQFDLSLRHSTWFPCTDATCLSNSENGTYKVTSRGKVSLTPDFPGWRDPRTTSGGSYYAVANDTLLVDIGLPSKEGDKGVLESLWVAEEEKETPVELH